MSKSPTRMTTPGQNTQRAAATTKAMPYVNLCIVYLVFVMCFFLRCFLVLLLVSGRPFLKRGLDVPFSGEEAGCPVILDQLREQTFANALFGSQVPL